MKKQVKRVIPLLLSFLLVFNLIFAPKKAHAIAPLVAWLAWTAAGVVADVAIEQGIKYVSKKVAKNTADKVTKKVLDNANDFDFTKSYGKKTKDGKVYIPATALDKQKVAKLWKDEYEVIADKSVKRKQQASNPKFEVDIDVIETDPYYGTGIDLTVKRQENATSQTAFLGVEWFSEVVDIKFEALPYEQETRITLIDSWNGHEFVLGRFEGGNPSNAYTLELFNQSFIMYFTLYDGDWEESLSNDRWYHYKSDSSNDSSYDEWLELKKSLAGYKTTFVYADGFIMPDTMKNIYDIPLNTPSKYDIGQSKPSDGIYIDLPDTYNDGNEYEITENNYQDFSTEIENYVAKQENILDMSTNNYDYSTTIINNYYTYEEGEKEPAEVENEITIIIDNDDNDGDGGGSDPPATGGGDVPSETNKFNELMGTVAQQMKDVYKGFTGFLEASVDGMKDLATGTVGLATFFTGWFSFMPSEFTSLLGIAFMMGVFAHFFRR